MRPAVPAAVPDWFTPNRTCLEEVVGQLVPFPFAHPEDTSSHVCLHENDYLRLSRHPEVLAARHGGLDASGGGQLASALYGGGSGADFHSRLRRALAESMRAGDALLGTSGWSVNVGLVQALAMPGLPIYLDQRAHASLWDGAQLSGGRPLMVRHNDPESLERRILREGPGLVCIDSWYSSDGTVAPLRETVEICERHDCMLILDEAHSFGMTGELAGGMAVAEGLAERVHVRTCSFSKALGGHGGFLAASRELCHYLSLRNRAMVFSSATAPDMAAGHLEALRIAQREPELAANALAMAERFRQKLAWLGIPHFESRCQIVSVPLSSPGEACRLYDALRADGVLGAVFTPPAVPAGHGLLRFTFHAHLDENAVDWSAQALRRALDLLHVETRTSLAA